MTENLKRQNYHLSKMKMVKTQLDVKLEHETVWLTQKQIAELFGTKRPAITKHLKEYLCFRGINRRKHMFHFGTHG